MMGIERIKKEDVLREMKEGEGGTRWNCKKKVRLDVAKYSFGSRVCNQWNKLPTAIVSSQCINTFKSNLEKIPEEHRGIIVNIFKRFSSCYGGYNKVCHTSLEAKIESSDI